MNDSDSNSKTDFESNLIQLEVLQKAYDTTLQSYENEKKRIINQWKETNGSSASASQSASPYGTAIKCSSNHFCVNVVDNKPICYGDSAGCLWNANDCTTDADCEKYNDSSPQYSDTECSAIQTTSLASDTVDPSPLNESGTQDSWQLETCTISQTSAQDTKLIKALNQKLIDLSTEIQAKIKSMNTSYTSTSQTKNDDFSKIVQRYGSLLQERNNIINALNDHQYLDETNSQYMIFADQSNSRYILWLYIAHLIVVFLIMTFFFPNVRINILLILAGSSLVFFFIVCTMYMYIPQVFLLWMILFGVLVIYRFVLVK
jgi:hypothetical protein